MKNKYFFSFILIVLSTILINTAKTEICTDQNIRSGVEKLKKLENCTVIEGSLVIALFHNSVSKDFENISFPNLVEITDFLLLYNVEGLQSLGKLFPNLTLIRGQKLFYNEYAIYVSELNQLQEVGLNKLTTIERGQVSFVNNGELCYVTTIDWDRITLQKDYHLEAEDNKATCNVCNNDFCPKINNDNSTQAINKYLCWSEKSCQKFCRYGCFNGCYTTNDKCCEGNCKGSCYEQQLTPAQMNGTQPLPSKMFSQKDNIAHVCTVCKNFELKNGSCANECPPHHYKYKNRRCVTKSECIKFSKINRHPELKKEPILFKPVKISETDLVCVEKCPDKFMINPENVHSCIRCDTKCYQQCNGGQIDNLAASEKFKQCTHINGDLIISLRRTAKDLEKKLTENLGQIETITGYLRITKSSSLQTLHFFKNLREIHGNNLDRKNYSLLVMDNTNLEELFPWNSSMNNYFNNVTHPQIKLSNGKVFFQLNPKLCINKILEMKNYTNINDFPESDVPDFSNGDNAACVIEKIELNLVQAEENKLLISWTHIKPNDFRTLLNYDIYYKESPGKNVTSYFENRDLCDENEWIYIYQDVLNDQIIDEAVATNMINNLKSATQYAIYVKANVLIDRTRTREQTKTGISDIEYFSTKPSQPSKPEKLILKQLSPSEIEANWKPPISPNGQIAYYKVVIEERPQTEIVFNDCEDKEVIQFNTEQKVNEKQAKVESFAEQQCSKSLPKSKFNQMRRIEVENALLNLVYPKAKSNNMTTIDDEYIYTIESNELKIYLNSTKFKEQLKFVKENQKNQKILVQLNNSTKGNRSFNMSLDEFKSFDLELDQIKQLNMNVTNLAKIGLNDNEIVQFSLPDSEQKLYEVYKNYFEMIIGKLKKSEPLSSRFKRNLFKREIANNNSSLIKNKNTEYTDPKSNNIETKIYKLEYYTFSNETIITNSTGIIIGGLEYYTDYSIKVFACQNISASELDPGKQCSNPQIHSIFSQKLPGANTIRNVSVEVNEDSETSQVHIYWSEPEKPNGQIKFYKIEYNLLNNENNKLIQCVTRQNYRNMSGFTFVNLPSGDYQFRIIAVSTGDKGDWTKLITFNVPERLSLIKFIVTIVVICIIIVAIIGFLIHNMYRKKAEMFYASVNPDYIKYEPDGWEIERGNVKFDPKAELGKGNYGVVYRGEYRKLIDSEYKIIPVAIKTSSAQNDLERYRFLKEASTMKDINCYHVISLIGVVSKGIPVLVLMELMENGDLKTYLRKHRPDENQEKNYKYDEKHDDKLNEESNKKLQPNKPSTSSTNHSKIEYKQILTWAIQIADGMFYLERNRYVHRDLAARNCLLSEDLIVKIADFGMAKDIYSDEYYRKLTRTQMPVRWCAPESLKDGKFTTQSDVWGYGIVLYEMVTLGSQPYQGLTNDQVLDFVTKQNGRIAKPVNCPENLYNIMDLCWAKDPKQRPSFLNIIEMLLPFINDEKFKEKSFYFEYINNPSKYKSNASKSNNGRSKRDIKKEEYLLDKNFLQDDGSDEPLTNQQQSESAELQIYNNSSNNSEKYHLDDFTSKESDLTAELNEHQNNSEYSENESSHSSSSQINNHKEDFNKFNLMASNQDMMKNKLHETIVEFSPDKKTELKNCSTSNDSSLIKKNRQESISYQSTSSASTSNEENFDNLIERNSALGNGNLPNGKILLNS